MRAKEHTFYVAVSLTAIAIMFLGFARTCFLRSHFHPEPLTWTLRLHGAAFTSWVVLLLVQTTLVSAKRTDIHRKLGWIGAGLAIFMIAIAVRAAIVATHAAVLCCNAELARGFLIVPFADVVVFGLLVGCAVAYRREPATHKRLMLLATLAILDAAVSRWPFTFIEKSTYGYLVVMDAIIVGVVAYDAVARRQLSRAFAWGASLVIVSHVVRETVRFSPAWKSVARLIIG